VFERIREQYWRIIDFFHQWRVYIKWWFDNEPDEDYERMLEEQFALRYHQLLLKLEANKNVSS